MRERHDNRAGRLAEMETQTKGRAGLRGKAQTINSYASMMQKFLSQLRHFDPKAFAEKKKDIEGCIAAGGKDWFKTLTRVSWAAHRMAHSADGKSGEQQTSTDDSVDRDNALELSNSTHLLAQNHTLETLGGPSAQGQAKILSEILFGMKKYASQAYFDPKQQQEMVVEILQRLEL